MKTVPVQGPIVQSSGTNPTPAAQDARARAIAMLTPTSNPVPVNANNVSVEEIRAVQAPTESTAEPVVAELATPEVKETKPEEKPLSDKYQLLKRKELALRAKAQQQEKSIRAREDAIKAKEQELQAKAKEYESGYIPKQQLRQAALDAILTGELPYDEVTENVMNQQRTDPRVMTYIQKLESKIQALEQGVEETRSNYINSQDQAYKAAIKQIDSDVSALVSSNPSDFETIIATRSQKDVRDLIERVYKKDGILMSVEDASREVEEYLVDEALKLAKLSKIQKRVQPAVQAKPQEPPPQKQPQPMKTLTNAASSTRKLSSRERALLAFKGELGKG